MNTQTNTNIGSDIEIQSESELPEKRQWEAPMLTTYKPVAETQASSGVQPFDGANNAS